MVILGAIDENERAKTVIDLGYDLAETYDDQFVPFHVIPEAEYQAHREAIRHISGFTEFTISQEVESAKEFARKLTLASIDSPDGSRIDPRGSVGDPPEEIIAIANNLDPRFLVICGKRRSPVGKVLFGSVAQQVLVNVSCPVVTKIEG